MNKLFFEGLAPASTERARDLHGILPPAEGLSPGDDRACAHDAAQLVQSLANAELLSLSLEDQLSFVIYRSHLQLVKSSL